MDAQTVSTELDKEQVRQVLKAYNVLVSVKADIKPYLDSEEEQALDLLLLFANSPAYLERHKIERKSN